MGGFHPYQAVLRQQLENRQTGVDLVLLEAAYNDDVKCQIRHIESVCSVDVTHRIESPCDGLAANMCTVAAEVKRRRMENGVTCRGCKKRARDCWVIRPI